MTHMNIRAATEKEIALLRFLLGAVASNVSELMAQTDQISVSPIDENGSLRLLPALTAHLSRINGLVVEGAFQQAGTEVSLLLHAKNGSLYELEVVPDDPRYQLVLPDLTLLRVLDRTMHPVR